MQNQLLPELSSIGINLNEGPQSVAASRKYMAGSYIPKACKTKGLTTRMITCGFERQYGKAARRIEAPANMTVVKAFYRKSVKNTGELADDWEELNVIYFNEDKLKYDLLVMPKYHTQNFYVGFEYKYDKEMIRRLEPNATFAKGEVFATSPGLADTGEWMFGMDAVVAPLTLPQTEEDGIVVTRSFLERLTVMFEHQRAFNWNDTEYIPLNLYGDDENYKPFPENGEPIRSDGLVMAFRRRDSKSAMASMTNKALRRVDHTFDIKFYGPAGGIVKSVSVKSERLKDKANNKNARPIMKHTELLERYENADNDMCNDIKAWYLKTAAKYKDKDADLPMTRELLAFIFQGYGNITFDRSINKPNTTKRTNRNKQLLNWNIEILIKEEVRGKIRFKLSDVNGGKGVIVHVIEDEFAPFDKNGRRAEIIVNNTPAFRRQIFTALVSQTINFININIHDQVKKLVKEPKGYQKSWKLLCDFYEAASPEFLEIVQWAYPGEDDHADHIDYILRHGITIERRSNSSVYGVEIIRRLMKKFSHIKPGKLTYFNELNQPVETLEDVPLTVVHYMLLDKFGTERSSESLSKSNMFGFPAKLNGGDKYSKWYRAVADRNSGETEERTEESQSGGEEAARGLVLTYSPTARHNCIKRIMRSDDPFQVPEVVKPEEYKTNRAISIATNYLTDSGYRLVEESPDHLFEGEIR